MGRRLGKSLMLLTGFVLVVAACSDDTAETTTTTPIPVETTTTLPVETTTSTTTTTLSPGGPPLIAEGDRNETVAAFQWLLVCGGHGTLTPDGNFGPTTATVLTSALAALGFTAPDEDAFAALSRDCADDRPITFEGDDPLIVVGNAAPGDPEIYTIPLEFDTALIVAVAPLDGVSLTLLDAADTPLEPQADTPNTWSIATTGAFSLVVTADLVPTTFTMTIEIGEDAEGVADWLITTTGITYKDTPKLAIGGASPGIIDKIFEYLGHGVRGGEEFDTGWDSPSQPDVRGISIEGFRFLFFGPEPGHLARIRVLAPTTDADGNPRPAFYVTTPEGIGPGHTKAELLTIYPGVTSGKNSDGEYFYRLTNSRGELCFYFGTTQPTDTSPILELSTMCRA